MASYITVKDLNHLYAMQNHEENEIAYVEDLKKIYSWQDSDGWQELNVENKGLQLNLYELNKNIMSQMNPMTKEDIYNKSGEIFEFYTEVAPNDYYMLLCREYNYYTLFAPDFRYKNHGEDDFVSAVLSIIEELGPVYSIEKTETAIEFWIKPEGSETPLAFYLFPYDAGVVYYE